MAKTWDTGLSVVRSCPYMRFDKRPIYVRAHILFLCRLLDNEFAGYEFLVYARARESDLGLIIEDPVIPEQTVSSTHVRVDRPDPTRNVVIHKHPSGVHEFSGIDDEYINANNFISILYVDGRFEKIVVKVRLPCGHHALIDIPVSDVMVLVEGGVSNEYEIARRVFEEQKSNVKKLEPGVPYSYPLGYLYGYYSRYKVEPSSDMDLDEHEEEIEYGKPRRARIKRR